MSLPTGRRPDIAGTGKANPLAMILSVAMMLQYSFKRLKEAEAVEKAVEKVLNDGLANRRSGEEGREDRLLQGNGGRGRPGSEVVRREIQLRNSSWLLILAVLCLAWIVRAWGPGVYNPNIGAAGSVFQI